MNDDDIIRVMKDSYRNTSDILDYYSLYGDTNKIYCGRMDDPHSALLDILDNQNDYTIRLNELIQTKENKIIRKYSRYTNYEDICIPEGDPEETIVEETYLIKNNTFNGEGTLNNISKNYFTESTPSIIIDNCVIDQTIESSFNNKFFMYYLSSYKEIRLNDLETTIDINDNLYHLTNVIFKNGSIDSGHIICVGRRTLDKSDIWVIFNNLDNELTYTDDIEIVRGYIKSGSYTPIMVQYYCPELDIYNISDDEEEKKEEDEEAEEEKEDITEKKYREFTESLDLLVNLLTEEGYTQKKITKILEQQVNEYWENREKEEREREEEERKRIEQEEQERKELELELQKIQELEIQEQRENIKRTNRRELKELEDTLKRSGVSKKDIAQMIETTINELLNEQRSAGIYKGGTHDELYYKNKYLKYKRKYLELKRKLQI